MEKPMRATLEQVDSFREFARQLLANGGANLTIDELYDRWRAEDDCRETVRAIQQSRAEFAAGDSQTLNQADADIRRQLGFAPRP